MPDFWAVAAILGFAASVQMASGFGFALVSVPLLALVVGPHHAVLLTLLVGTLFNGWQAAEGHGRLDRALVVRVLLSAGLAMPAGYLLYRALSPDALIITVGALVLVAVAVLATGWTITPRATATGDRVADWVAGACTGLLTTSTGTNGPPLVTLLQARGLEPDAFRATVTTVFLALDAVAVALYLRTGDMTISTIAQAAGALPLVCLGGFLGHRVRRVLTPERFRSLVLGLLLLSGCAAVVSGLT